MTLRILLIGPTIQYPWVEYTARALTRLGHVVTSVRYNASLVNRAASPLLARTLAGIPAAPAVLARAIRRWRQARDRWLVTVARRMRPDLILVLKGETISRGTLEEMKRAALGPLVTWWVDNPWLYPAWLECLPVFDAMFIFDRSYLPRLGAAGMPRCRFLPCACDETVYQPRCLSRAEQARYHCEIALVAWYDAKRAGVVSALREFDLRVWGRGWASREARRALDGAGRAMVHGSRFLSGERTARIYSAAAIGLNVHTPQSREAGLNTRAFELLAAGAFELTDAIPGMEELLRPGEEVAVYHSVEEARDLARYYLAHPDARTQMVTRGRARTLREHTYVSRMRALLKAVGG